MPLKIGEWVSVSRLIFGLAVILVSISGVWYVMKEDVKANTADIADHEDRIDGIEDYVIRQEVIQEYNKKTMESIEGKLDEALKVR